MPRGARFAFKNAFYHVFNRGSNKQEIFLEDEDYRFFLNRIKKLNEKYDHSLYAVCLMPNHFHLSIQTRTIPISKIMASLATSYSMYFNKKYNHVGSVFQNRYKSILIQNDSYFLALSRYIYLNPVKADIVSDPLLYPYSSFNEVIGEKPLFYLDADIKRLTGDTKESQEKYKEFVYEGIKTDLSAFEMLFQTEEATLGTPIFSRMAQTKYIRKKLLSD